MERRIFSGEQQAESKYESERKNIMENTTEIMETNETTEVSETKEKHEKFKADSKERMSKIYVQITQLEKISTKRSVYYTPEDVEKMFSYLEKKLADCKAAYMERFNEETDAKNSFDFEF